MRLISSFSSRGLSQRRRSWLHFPCLGVGDSTLSLLERYSVARNMVMDAVRVNTHNQNLRNDSRACRGFPPQLKILGVVVNQRRTTSFR